MSRALSLEAAAAARSKFEELKKLTEQRQLVNLELISKLAKALEKVKAVPASAPAAPSAFAPTTSKQQAATKRSSQPTGLAVPEPKRPKLDSVGDKLMFDIWKACGAVLEFLMKKKNAVAFNKPVDPVGQGVPDYLKYITHPMDLGTIRNKLRERKYDDPREFAADVRLVWSNCRHYNQVGTMVRTWGDQLSDDFERKWAELNVEQRYDELIASRNPESIPLERRIASSARQLIQRVNSVKMLPEADPSRPMTQVEKRKLSVALSELQGDQLGEVLNIIADSLKDINPDDEEEIELDVDQLDNATLWRLRDYCDNVANRGHGGGAGGGGGASRPAAAAPNKAGGGVGGASRPVQEQRKQQQEQRSKLPARTESGSESDRYSAEQDVKGSNMVEQPQSQPNFVKNQRTAIPVDESATAPKDKSAIATDKKSNKDVVLNASAWQAADEEPAEGGAAGGAAGGDENGDDLWDSFRTVAEREQQQKAEEEKRRKELEQERERERLRAVAEARQAKEEEERKMREAEEAAAAEAKRAKDEARQKELEELQMQANTAQVYQPPDAKVFASTFGAGGADINDLGLTYKHDDDADDVGFDD